ncbi:uncharacterized protein N7503_003526 [Penicillium pulvis]|uniref:uncharacterized protein n=1 Tax=Penicillium pulvis TaxID=1562058 RepID=UPI0025477CF1|nr:uncharacterized protein N7503_003526 [Penicillium pulvis]KAJ5805924.1 hypothetical protein N7503_003526 [Penicillium pulvis]
MAPNECRSHKSKSWADGPWPLIETPSKTQDTSKHASIYIANEMAFAHNAMLRGLNSLYLQVDLSDPKDISDFLFFLRSWAGWVSHHHVLEEERMFPQFEEAMKQPNFLQGNVEEHHIFQPVLKKLLAYADIKPEEYQASTVRSLIEEMAPSFREHLAHEITSLLSMAPYDSQALLKVYKGCEAEASRQDKFVVPPMVLGLRDITFEGGNQWPALPPLSTYLIHYLLARKHAGSWRFLPSDAWGNPRQLKFATSRVELISVARD